MSYIERVCHYKASCHALDPNQWCGWQVLFVLVAVIKCINIGAPSFFNYSARVCTDNNNCKMAPPSKASEVAHVASMMNPICMKDHGSTLFLCDIVYQRRKLCNSSKPFSRCRCSACKDLMGRMKTMYHVKDEWWVMSPWEAQTELAMRCVYEVVFGFISLEHVHKGTWLQRGVHACDGHHRRLVNLYRRAVLNGSRWYFPWLAVPVNKASLLQRSFRQ